jgi:peptidoglycan hydrolase-like protein with peptidoglycan-binding domain
MNRSSLSILLALALPLAAAAADQLRDVQTELKTQGFYYGELNGQNSPETVAAIRRYQIRNGLEVTGTLTKETLDALGIAGAPAREPAPAPVATPKPRPPTTLRRSEPVENNDRDFLRREEAARPTPQPAPPPAGSYDPSVVAPPAPLDPPSADFPVLFAETPYATAPREVQEATLRRAQEILLNRGFYRAAVDGLPGPATEEALLSYQRSVRMPLTGRLDLQTLSSLRLLPGRSQVPIRGIVREPSGPQRVYRGIIVR